MITASDYRALRVELSQSGAFAHRTARTSIKLGVLLLAIGASLALVALLPWWCALLLVPLAGVFAATAAMVGHEAAHGSFSASKWKNEIVLHILFPLFAGLSAQHWKNKHNRLHHGHPNTVGRDPDMNVWPMALTRAEYQASSRFRRWFQRELQVHLFWPLTTLLAFAMRLDSIKFVVARMRAGKTNRALVADAACLVTHYSLWLVLPSLWLGFWPVALVYAGLWATTGLCLSMVFTPAHIGLPLIATDQRPGWQQQLETTRNLTMPRWLSWFFVGLDYQVEHHLFPRIPHQNLAAASAVVASWCERNGAPHNRIAYVRSLGSVTRHLRSAWRDEPLAGASELAAQKYATSSDSAITNRA
jgi:fatty acid desaturase